MARVKLVLVGGFLGAGKTTLMARAAQRLSSRGLRVGLVTNDQAANLVDTELLRRSAGEVREVSGACFCCAFHKFLYVCENLIDLHRPDVILGEPVGSCTDLSATVLRPVQIFRGDRLDAAPYSVLVDAGRAMDLLRGGEAAQGADRAIRYIYRKQIEEADLIVLNKTDALCAARREEARAALEAEFPRSAVLAMSALLDQGVDEWLDRVLAGGSAGGRAVEVDYDLYAAGEAALGWLNAAVELSARQPADWRAFAEDFLERCQAHFLAQAAEIAHLKLLLTCEGGQVQANLTGGAARPLVQGQPAGPSRYATLVLNARVRTSPEELKAAVQTCLRQACGDAIAADVAELACLSPGRPVPVHRLGTA